MTGIALTALLVAAALWLTWRDLTREPGSIRPRSRAWWRKQWPDVACLLCLASVPLLADWPSS